MVREKTSARTQIRHIEKHVRQVMGTEAWLISVSLFRDYLIIPKRAALVNICCTTSRLPDHTKNVMAFDTRHNAFCDDDQMLETYLANDYRIQSRTDPPLFWATVRQWDRHLANTVAARQIRLTPVTPTHGVDSSFSPTR